MVTGKASLILGLFLAFPGDDPSIQAKKIPVLSVGTFHMTCTSDSYTTPFDAKDPKRIKEIGTLVEKLATFKPTIIAIEYPFDDQKTLDKEFQSYLQGTRTPAECDGESVLVGFELAKQMKLTKVHGIDSKLNYDYEKIMSQANETGNQVYKDFFDSQPAVFKLSDKKFVDTQSVVDLVKFVNREEVLNELYLLNAGIFAYVNKNDGYEGADVAADFYKRNLRMFANLNRIEVRKDDRILILCGAGHTVFFNDFVSRSPKYELQDLATVLR